MSERGERLALGLLLLVAILLRAVGLGRGELWHDECGSLLMTRWPGGIWNAAAAPTGTPDGGNPPLYYALLAAWTHVFGLSATAARSLSAVLGVAQVAALAWLAAALRLSRSARVAAVTLAAAGALPVLYGMEARAYGLLLLLLTIALAAWAEAMARGGVRWWALHGATLLLAAYTHNLALPFAAAFWLATAVRGGGRRAWTGLAIAHGAALVAYLPWVGVLLGQVGGDAHHWIRLHWEKTPPWLLVPRTLEVFGLGGRMPDYLFGRPTGGAVRALAILVLAAAALGLERGDPGDGRSEAGGAGRARPRRTRAVLATFVFVPLLFLMIYSGVKAPLYLVGRYDLPAFPAFALLFGIGIAGLGGLLPRRARRPAAALALAVGVFLTFHAHRATLERPALVAPAGADAALGEILAAGATGDDLVVATGFTTSRIWLATIRRGLDLEIATFPASLRDHFGWDDPEADRALGPAALRRDAEALLDRIRRGENRRLWFFFHPEAQPGSAYGDVIDAFFTVAAEAPVRADFPPGREAEWRRRGVIALEASDPADEPEVRPDALPAGGGP